MEWASLAAAIVAAYHGLSAQLKKAARYVIDNPHDVALLTMRDQARRAGVQPATMMRLAKRLGYDGYDAMRESHAEPLHNINNGFSGKAGEQTP